MRKPRRCNSADMQPPTLHISHFITFAPRYTLIFVFDCVLMNYFRHVHTQGKPSAGFVSHQGSVGKCGYSTVYTRSASQNISFINTPNIIRYYYISHNVIIYRLCRGRDSKDGIRCPAVCCLTIASFKRFSAN